MDNNFFILLTMIFFHIVDDYYLQGWLAQGKQKKWWSKLTLDNPKKYKYDYIMALFMHSFSWTFMTMFPIVIFQQKYSIPLFALNIVIHMFVDDLKANKMKINLITDQTIHLIQVFVTWSVLLKVW